MVTQVPWRGKEALSQLQTWVALYGRGACAFRVGVSVSNNVAVHWQEENICFTINDPGHQINREPLSLPCSFAHARHYTGHLSSLHVEDIECHVTETMTCQVAPVTLMMRDVSIINQRIWVLVLHAQSDPVIFMIPISLGNQAQSNDLQLATPNEAGRVQVEAAGRVGCGVPYSTCLPGDTPTYQTKALHWALQQFPRTGFFVAYFANEVLFNTWWKNHSRSELARAPDTHFQHD